MKARAHVILSGYVQGIFFRSFIRNVARMKKLAGWTRNMPSGQVEILFEGDKDQILAAVEECRSGPPGARVGDVQIKWQNYDGNLTTFDIR